MDNIILLGMKTLELATELHLNQDIDHGDASKSRNWPRASSKLRIPLPAGKLCHNCQAKWPLARNKQDKWPLAPNEQDKWPLAPNEQDKWPLAPNQQDTWPLAANVQDSTFWSHLL